MELHFSLCLSLHILFILKAVSSFIPIMVSDSETTYLNTHFAGLYVPLQLFSSLWYSYSSTVPFNAPGKLECVCVGREGVGIFLFLVIIECFEVLSINGLFYSFYILHPMLLVYEDCIMVIKIFF